MAHTIASHLKTTLYRTVSIIVLSAQIISCGTLASTPDARKTEVPNAERPGSKFSTKAVNRVKDAPVVYVRLGKDVLKPVRKNNTDSLPDKQVGPYELREETLAAALQLVMAGSNIPLAFQTSEALARTVTVSQLHGPMNDMVERLCSLADLYCSYEKGVLIIKDVETFSVSLPPIADENYDQFLNGIQSVTGREAYIDATTRTLIYSTSHRNSERATEYFDRLRTNTALIVFETQIWEVTLNNGNDAGIKWEALPVEAGQTGSSSTISNGNLGFDVSAPGSEIAGAISGGIRYLSGDLNANFVLQFLSSQGSVKTISQPQITVLSGSTAKMRVGNSQKYISQITRTAGLNANGDSLSLTTDTLETGLNMEINSAWDNATVYGGLKLDLQDLVNLTSVDVGGPNGTKIQLPETSERSIETRIRVRPGDALIIGGIVQERDRYDKKGLGGLTPVVPTSRNTSARNSELVIMMRPHVVVYTDSPPSDAVLLNDGLFLENPTGNVPAVNVMAPPAPDAVVGKTPVAVVQQPAIAPPVNTVRQATREVTITDTQVISPPPPARPRPLSQQDVQRLRQQSSNPPVSDVPTSPSMSQYLSDLAPMQIAPQN